MAKGRQDTANNVTAAIELLVDGTTYLTPAHWVSGVTVHSCPVRFGVVVDLAQAQALSIKQVGAAAQDVFFAAMLLN